MSTLLSLASLAALFAAYGYCGRLAVSKGYRAGESGSSFTLAWPFYIRVAPYFLVLAMALFGSAAIWASAG